MRKQVACVRASLYPVASSEEEVNVGHMGDDMFRNIMGKNFMIKYFTLPKIPTTNFKILQLYQKYRLHKCTK